MDKTCEIVKSLLSVQHRQGVLSLVKDLELELSTIFLPSPDGDISIPAAYL